MTRTEQRPAYVPLFLFFFPFFPYFFPSFCWAIKKRPLYALFYINKTAPTDVSFFYIFILQRVFLSEIIIIVSSTYGRAPVMYYNSMTKARDFFDTWTRVVSTKVRCSVLLNFNWTQNLFWTFPLSIVPTVTILLIIKVHNITINSNVFVWS